MAETNLRRVFKFADNDFSRNSGISIAAVLVLTLTTLLVTFLFFIGGMSSHLISSIEDKVDITAYFKESTEEQDILGIRDEILQGSDVKSAEYVSEDDALATFLATHEDNPDIADA